MYKSSILSSIWERSTGQYIFMPKRRGGVWVEGEPINIDTHSSLEIESFISLADDSYFTPLRFTKPARSNSTTGGCGVLFADLDQADAPLDCPPTVLWTTSPGMLQAVWFLNVPISDYDQWAGLNRALTYHTGADRGGWMGSKVLRVPATKNYKRNEAGDAGRVVRYSPKMEYCGTELMRHFKVPPKVTVHKDREAFPDGPRPILPGGAPYDLVYWLNIDPVSYARGHKPDRSRLIWGLLDSMKRFGITGEHAFLFLKDAPFNKWKHNPNELWRQVQKAYLF